MKPDVRPTKLQERMHEVVNTNSQQMTKNSRERKHRSSITYRMVFQKCQAKSALRVRDERARESCE